MKRKFKKPRRSVPPLAEFDRALPSLATYRKELFWFWNNERDLLGLAVLQFFAGFSLEESALAAWDDVSFDDRTIRSALRQGPPIPLNTAYDWLLTIRPDSASGPISTHENLLAAWFAAVQRFQAAERVPWSSSLVRMYRPYIAYCAMPASARAATLKGYWKYKVQLYARRGAQLQRLTPGKVLRVTKKTIDQPAASEQPVDTSELDLL